MVEAKLPPGFRFHPSDEELVCDYLMKKVAHSDSSLMIDLDLNKCEPWDIPGQFISNNFNSRITDYICYESHGASL